MPSIYFSVFFVFFFNKTGKTNQLEKLENICEKVDEQKPGWILA